MFGRKLSIGDKPRASRWLKLAFAVFLLVLLCVAASMTMLAKATDSLMRRETKELNILAENLVPSHDNLRFTSIDKNATLAGWFFRASGNARGNIIMIHDNLNNRLQFDLETVNLYRFLRDEGFNVLSFDLRHSGQSTGEISAYGYLEYLDVLSAIREVERLSNSDRHILMGFGSGCAAALLAWNELPDRPVEEGERKHLLQEINSSKENIRAMILDTISSSADDYIRADLEPNGFFNKLLYYPFIPTTVRLSAGHDKISLSPLLAQLRAPVMITRNIPELRLQESHIEAAISERLRLKSELTLVWETTQPGSVSGWLDDPDTYKDHLKNFLDRWLAAE